ncbi:MAG TPA: hypothetical protein VJI98_03275 [Candidatus Nanoarchaeia archaeon]|nr:hypothetical protein [Candidatus Nanoarchaeia archaeon]
MNKELEWFLRGFFYLWIILIFKGLSLFSYLAVAFFFTSAPVVTAVIEILLYTPAVIIIALMALAIGLIQFLSPIKPRLQKDRLILFAVLYFIVLLLTRNFNLFNSFIFTVFIDIAVISIVLIVLYKRWIYWNSKS